MHEKSSSLSSSSSSSSSLDDETLLVSTKKPDKYQDKDQSIESIFQEPPDVTFVVEGIEFPCHLKILSKRCVILHDLVSVHGIQQRLSKKQRTLTQTQEKAQTQAQERKSMSSSQLMITVTELRNVEHEIFRALLEFLYTNEIPGACYWGDKQEEYFSPSKKADHVDCDQCPELSRERPIYHAMGFLQRLLVAADRFHMVALKHEIENKIYDEFLYSFTSAELFVWADSHSCAFLKEKAMDRICKKSGSVDDFVISKDGWSMIRESKRLLEELFLYATYGCHGVRYNKYKDHASDYKSNELYYYNVEYLRLRLSEFGLDIDGTREMLEERLRPHLDVNHRHFLPTKLTILSEKDTGLDQYQKVCSKQTTFSE